MSAAGNNTIAVDPKLIFPAAQPMAGVQTPYVMIALPDEPYENDKWAGSSNLKDSLFKVRVIVVAELLKELTTPTGNPYGSETVTGLLTISDQVQDALENAYAALLAASTHVVDVTIGSTAHARIGPTPDSRQVAAITLVTFRVRFFAGNRN